MSAAVKRWIPALLWAATIFVLSAQSRIPVQVPWVLSWDKLQHASAYAIGGAALAYALCVSARGPWPWLPVILGMAYGASDEVHQWFVPGRNSDARDWVADTVGVVAGVFLYRLVLSWRERRARRVLLPEP